MAEECEEESEGSCIFRHLGRCCCGRVHRHENGDDAVSIMDSGGSEAGDRRGLDFVAGQRGEPGMIGIRWALLLIRSFESRKRRL